MTRNQAVLLTYGVLGVALWPLPLLNIVHVESAAVVACVAFFVSGVAAIGAFGAGRSFGQVLLRQAAALGVPLVLLTVSLLWAPNCDYGRGLLFYALFPGVTVVFAVALAYAIQGVGWPRPRLILIVLGVVIGLGGVAYDLGLHPQFYTYNHVFGGVLGPIYDERLAVRPGLFAFRGLTLLWALAAYGIGRRSRGHGRAVPLTAGVLLLIGLCYLFSARLGFNTPAWYLQEQLGAHRATAHFDIYYDSTAVRPDEIDAFARDHEYRYAWLAEAWGASGPDRIASYLYPDAGTKARLTGARQTSVAPVWLADPQTHLLQSQYRRSFGHELVHVFARPYGLPLIRASWSVGLVEGMAVAFEPPDGRPTPREQVAVAAQIDTSLASAGRADDLAARFSPIGFWTGRGAVSYTTMGAFVRFLAEAYGTERLRRVYARANFEEVYGRSVQSLAHEWQAWLASLTVVDRATEALVTRRFARPSLFERRCPHYVPPHRRALAAGRAALTRGDTTEALGQFQQAVLRQPRSVDAQAAWGRLQLDQGAASAVAARLDTLSFEAPVPTLTLLQGDAAALIGHPDRARDRYRSARAHYPRFEPGGVVRLLLREAVADRPEVMRVLVSRDSAATQAQQLARWAGASPAVRAWQALREMEAGAFASAQRLWNSMPPLTDSTGAPWDDPAVHRQIGGWKAICALRLGQLRSAERYATETGSAFRRVGALNLADQLDDLAQKARWLQTHSRFTHPVSAPDKRPIRSSALRLVSYP